MAVQADGNAPYAPPATVMDVIMRHRDRGLSTPFDLDVLTRAGVTEALAPRVLQALKLLDLVNAGGEPTEEFEGLRVAPSSEFPKKLEEVLRTAYADVFNYVNPAEDSLADVTDAFRSYKPPGQRGRMVTLFLGLCKEAGIIEAAPTRPKSEANGRSPSQRPRRSSPPPPRQRQRKSAKGEIPPQIESLLATLPSPDDGWTKGKRDQFLAAFGAILDYTYPIREALPPGTPAAEEEELP